MNEVIAVIGNEGVLCSASVVRDETVCIAVAKTSGEQVCENCTRVTWPLSRRTLDELFSLPTPLCVRYRTPQQFYVVYLIKMVDIASFRDMV